MMRNILIFIWFLLPSNISDAQNLIILAQQETKMYNQTWFYSGSGNSLQETKIKEYWNEDFYINSIAYTSKGWFVTMAKGLKWTNQSYSYKSSWPDEWIHEKKKAGYMITSLSSSNSNWMVVMSQNTDYNAQEICSAPWATQREWIKKWWNNDYYITSVTCRNGMWTVVMSKTALYTDQTYMFSSTVDGIKEKIKIKWDEGYRIIAFEYGGGEYLCVMCKLANAKTPMQKYQINSSDINNFIKEIWNDSYDVIYVGG